MIGPEIDSAQVAAAAPELNISTRWSWALVAIEFALFVGALGLLWPTTSSLIVEWEDTTKTTYTHGYLIVLICAWLLLRGRDVRTVAQPAIRVGLLVPIAALSVLWLLVLRSGLQAAHEVLLPPLFLLALWSTLGFQAALRATFTAGYLYFAIPIWSVVNDLLQSTTTLVVSQLLRITGVSAYVDGNIVHLAAGTFEIAGGCSGLHFFIVGAALAALYGEIHRDSIMGRLKLLMLAIGLALLANWLRVYIIVLAGYLTDMQHYLVRVSHYGFGWSVFSVTMVAFFFVASRMAVTAVAIPVADFTGPRAKPGVLLLAAALSLAAVAVGPVWNILVPLRTTPLSLAGDAWLPRNLGAWKGPVKAHSADWVPTYPAADAVQVGTYSNGALNVQMFTAVYASQSQGKELVTYDNSIAGSADVVESRDLTAAKELVIVAASGQRWVLRYFYKIDSLRVHRDLEEQLRYGLASLAGQPASAIFAFGAPCAPDCDAARAAIDNFAAAASPQIEASAAGTQDDRS